MVELVTKLTKYVEYLKSQLATTQQNQASLEPVRNASAASTATCVIKATPVVFPAHVTVYKKLVEELRASDTYQPVYVNDFESQSGVPPRKYRQHLDQVMPFTVRKFVYSTGNNKGDALFLWKIDAADGDEEFLKSSQCISDVRSQLPLYHTRAMQHVFAQKAGRICSLKPAQLRALYRELTGDTSVSEDAVSKTVDSRIQFVLSSEDSDLVWDLRELNGGPPQQYEHFWKECRRYLEESSQTAVDDR